MYIYSPIVTNPPLADANAPVKCTVHPKEGSHEVHIKTLGSFETKPTASKGLFSYESLQVLARGQCSSNVDFVWPYSRLCKQDQ